MQVVSKTKKLPMMFVELHASICSCVRGVVYVSKNTFHNKLHLSYRICTNITRVFFRNYVLQNAPRVIFGIEFSHKARESGERGESHPS